jgi:hypothetical protein
MKRIILLTAIFSILLFQQCVQAQNKKEQILILSGKIDSLNGIVGKEREEHQLAKLKSQKEIIHLGKELLLSKGQTDSVFGLLEKERLFNKEMYDRFQQEKLNQEKQFNELKELKDLLVKERDSLNGALKNLDADLKMKIDLTIKTDTLQLSEVEKIETCEVLHFKTKNEIYQSEEISFYFGSSSDYPEINGINFFLEDEESGFIIGNESLVGSYFVVTYKVTSPYIFFDCEPLGESERRQGEGRPASIGFQLLSVKKL